MYDVIIAGASFAGLSTAYFTKADKILILEKEKELGLKQRSACCTFSDELKKLKCERSILKTFNSITFHSSFGSKANIKLIYPVSTFDYKIFCESLAKQLEEKNVGIITDSDVFKVVVNKSSTSKKVFCKNGKIFQGKILVDCSGWRAVMASYLKKDYFDRTKLAYGIETEVGYEGENDKINFYFGKKFIPGGYGWVFPISEDKARIGLGSYKKVDLTKYLESFLDFLDVDVKTKNLNVHGGILPCFGLRELVVEDIFVVGDAAGHILPFTGEGIRKSFHYGKICGNLISKVLNDGLELSTALEEYREEVNKGKKLYDNLNFIQKIAIHTPDKVWDKLISKLSKKEEKDALKDLQKIYLNDSNERSAKLTIFTILRKVIR